jgi:cholesterol oxidase
MTLLVGTQGVKSVIAGQFTVHPQTSLLNRIKAALDVGHILGEFGVKTVAPDSKFSVPNVLLDLGLRLVPMPAHEHCGQAVCRWINAIYGCTHHHGQLDDATHKELNALFGVGNAAALNHLGLMMKRRRAVDHTGNDPYLPNVERLALPILLLQGKLNYIFHPSGSAKTLKWLQKANGRSFYERRVLDDYAHLDTLIGKNAARDVSGAIADRFEKTGA